MGMRCCGFLMSSCKAIDVLRYSKVNATVTPYYEIASSIA